MRIPPGKGALLVLAVAAVPVVLSRFKPLAKKIGKGLKSAGEAMDRAGSSEPAPAKPREDVGSGPHAQKAANAKKKREGTPSGAKADNTASPTAQPEVEAQATRSAKKSGTATSAPTAKKQPKGGATAPKNNPKKSRPKAQE